MPPPFTAEQQQEIELRVRENIAESLAVMGRALREGAKDAGGFNTVLGSLSKTISGPVGLTVGVAALGASVGKMLLDFGQSRMQLQLFADASRLTSREIVAMQDTLTIAGRTNQQANTAISNITGTLRDLWRNKYWSGAASELQVFGKTGQDITNRLVGAMHAGDVSKGIDEAIKIFEAGGPRTRAALAAAFHVEERDFLDFMNGYRAQLDKTKDINDQKITEVRLAWNGLVKDLKHQVWEPLVIDAMTAFVNIAQGAEARFKGVPPPGSVPETTKTTPTTTFQQKIQQGTEGELEALQLRQAWEGMAEAEGSGKKPPPGRLQKFLQKLWGGTEPKMAEGGTVMGPTRALLGEKEPEVVIPLSKLKRVLEGGVMGGLGINDPISRFLQNESVQWAMGMMHAGVPTPGGSHALGWFDMILDAVSGVYNQRGNIQKLFGLGGNESRELVSLEQDSTHLLGDVRNTLQHMEASPIAKFAGGGIVTRPTRALVGEAGPEMIISIPQAYNNPGNIKWGKWAMAHGAIGRGSRGSHAVFATPEEGMSALSDLVQERMDAGQTTVHSFQYNKSGAWAESSGGRPIREWETNVSRFMGIRPSDPIPSVSIMAAAIARQEGFSAKMDQSLSSRRVGASVAGSIDAEVAFVSDARGSRYSSDDDVFKKININNIRQGQPAQATTAEPYTWAISP